MSGLLSKPAEEDNGERAQRQRIPGVIQVPLKQIGFWPDNRGSTGICPTHVHEVAKDIVVNRTKLLDRYNKVGLIKIPANKVTEARAFNNKMSEESDCMLLSNPSDDARRCTGDALFDGQDPDSRHAVQVQEGCIGRGHQTVGSCIFPVEAASQDGSCLFVGGGALSTGIQIASIIVRHPVPAQNLFQDTAPIACGARGASSKCSSKCCPSPALLQRSV